MLAWFISHSAFSTSGHIGTAQTVGLTLSSGTRVVVAASWAGPRQGWQNPAEPLGQPEGPRCPQEGCMAASPPLTVLGSTGLERFVSEKPGVQ